MDILSIAVTLSVVCLANKATAVDLDELSPKLPIRFPDPFNDYEPSKFPFSLATDRPFKTIPKFSLPIPLKFSSPFSPPFSPRPCFSHSTKFTTFLRSLPAKLPVLTDEDQFTYLLKREDH
ncbi:Hypothetical protein CINCED_3A020062 [Cinara cedri]|uniref:Uncharacterized protein n=1 Tax=Cinara cedri TaxID=506608 RepID=A0A5E4M2U5_9HEMI|nr:Hypothetical protein CINCED_3A020062 [Cinara cedri]